jgi:hypothetical protein
MTDNTSDTVFCTHIAEFNCCHGCFPINKHIDADMHIVGFYREMEVQDGGLHIKKFSPFGLYRQETKLQRPYVGFLGSRPNYR